MEQLFHFQTEVLYLKLCFVCMLPSDLDIMYRLGFGGFCVCYVFRSEVFILKMN